MQPVYAPALLYGSSLDTWTPEMTTAVARTMKNVNDQGITVWLRFLFEMVSDDTLTAPALAV